jgi:aldehyde dehydrogenase (NAD+)
MVVLAASDVLGHGSSIGERALADPPITAQRLAHMLGSMLTTLNGEVRMLIDGALVEARSGRRFANVNPANEQVLGEVADSGHEDVDAAIAAARRAFDETQWSSDRELRKRCLTQLHEAISAERDQLRAELMAEVGAPIGIMGGLQLDGALDHEFPWPIEFMDRFDWERELPDNPTPGMVSWRRVLKEPVGVVAAIVPWNFPFEVAVSKLVPGLATGNTVILKAAPQTPWNATRIGRLAAEQTDIPPGVLQVLTTSDNAVAEDLVTDPRVDMISFTGSTAVGRRIMAAASPTLKRLFLELGGKSAHVALDDADLERCLAASAIAACRHGGQSCATLTRVLLPRGRYDEGLEIIAARFAEVRYGDPHDPAVIQGPQISAVQRDRILAYIEFGVAEGARLVTGGGRPRQLPVGYYVEPTLFGDVDNEMKIAREEIFGPVLVVIPYDDEDDAVRIANDSPYGLSSAVSSGSEERGVRVARRLRAGTASINGGVWLAPDSPFGGYKASGIGRQNGLEGFEQYTETKTIAGPLAA